MTNPILDALTVKLQAVVDAQLALNWTPPALRKSLQASLTSVAKIGATLEIASPAGNGTPPSAGRKTDPLSLGVGVSVAAAASISAGLSLNIGISATAGLLAQVTTGLHQAISATADLERELATFNAQASLVAGFNGVMPPGRKVEQGAVNRTLRGLNSKISDCQSKASAAAAAVPVSPISAELRLQRMGEWFCDIDIDAETTQSGKITFQLDDIEFTGTVVPDKSGMDGARARCRVVAGNGNVSRVVSARSYSQATGVRVGTIVADILRECGEDLSDLSDDTALAKKLPRWHVVGGTAKDALTALAEATDCAWRMLRDGTVWFGEERWPEVEPDGTLTNENWSDGVVELASETPNMVPGTIYQGQKIEHVTHRYGATLRTEIRTSSPKSVASKLFKSRQHEVDFSREYPCKVVTQHPDGTLQLLPDDAVMKASGLDRVPIRYGLPGFRAKLKNGARCHLAFAAGDPSRPYVGLWEFDETTVESVEMVAGGRSAPLARLGDPCTFFVTPGIPIPIVGTVSSPVLGPTPAPLTGIMTISTPMVGAVNGGNPILKG